MTPTASPPAPPSEPGNNGTSYSESRILRISGAASLLSWFFAILGVFALIWGLYLLSDKIVNWASYDTVFSIVLPILLAAFLTLQCFFFSTIMRAISEGIFMLRDIEENTRSHP